MGYLKSSFLFLCIAFFSFPICAQLTGLSGGLGFSSGISYNKGRTGNPALFIKANVKVNNKLHVVPSFSAFNKFLLNDLTTGSTLETFMLQADIDGMYGLYNDKSKKIFGLAGINSTAIFSRYNTISGSTNIVDKSVIKPGLNLGGSLQLYINNRFDAYISLKYVLSTYNQGVINIGAIYYLGGKRRR